MSFLQFLLKDQLSALEIELSETQQLISLLQELPKTCSRQIIAPVINSVCLQPVKLIHTNEVLVKLGDQYYVERSAFQAIEISQRKTQQLNEKISKIKKQLIESELEKEKGTIKKTGKKDSDFFEIVETFEESEQRARECKAAPKIHSKKQEQQQQQQEEQQSEKLMLNGIPFEQTETYKIFQQFKARGKEENSSSEDDEKSEQKAKQQKQMQEFKKIGEKVSFEMPQIFTTDKDSQMAKLNSQNQRVSKFKAERMKLKQQQQQQQQYQQLQQIEEKEEKKI